MNFPTKLKIIMVLCIVPIIAIFTMPGCAGTKAAVPHKLDELSLVDMWNAVANQVDLQEQGAELESLYLHSDTDRNVNTLYFKFQGYTEKGRAHVYNASIYGKSEMNIQANGISSVQPTRHPFKIFEEIDTLGIASLETGEEGMSMLIDFQYGDIGYSYDNLDIYHLDNGTLLPLKEIIFHSSYPWCTVSVFKLVPNETVITEDGRTIARATTAAAPVPPEERTSQIWFIGEDINKATTVEYLKSEMEIE
jgi:hypothetical protein